MRYASGVIIFELSKTGLSRGSSRFCQHWSQRQIAAATRRTTRLHFLNSTKREVQIELCLMATARSSHSLSLSLEIELRYMASARSSLSPSLSASSLCVSCIQIIKENVFYIRQYLCFKEQIPYKYFNLI